MLRLVVVLSMLLSAGSLAADSLKIIDLSESTRGQKILSEFYIRSLMPWDFKGMKVTETKFTFDCETLSEKQCESIDAFTNDSLTLEFSAGRSHWMNQYLQTRPERGNVEIIPDTVKEFENISGYKSWPKEAVDSRVKGTVRVLYRGILDQRKVSVAETTFYDNGEAHVREVEVAVESKRSADNYDFYAYDEQGKISLESEFPAGVRPSPLICVNCHMNGNTKKTDRFFPRF